MPSWASAVSGVGRHHLDRVLVRLVLGEVDLGVERLLAERLATSATAPGRPGASGRATASSSSVGGHDPVHEPQSAAVRGVDGVAGERHLERALAPDVAGDGDERRVAEQPALAAGRWRTRRPRRRRRGRSWRRAGIRRRWRARGPWRTPAGGSPGSSSIISVHTSKRRRASSSVGPGHVGEVVPGGETGPLAASTTPHAVARAPTSASVARQLEHHSSASALRFSGRLRVTVTIAPSCLTSRCWRVMAPACLRPAVTRGDTRARGGLTLPFGGRPETGRTTAGTGGHDRERRYGIHHRGDHRRRRRPQQVWEALATSAPSTASRRGSSPALRLVGPRHP